MTKPDNEVIEDWFTDLQSEKSIYAAIRVAIKHVGDPRELRWLWSLTLLTAIVNIIGVFVCNGLYSDLDDAVALWAALLPSTLGYYAGLAGFIFAGYSLLIGLFNNAISVELAMTPHNESGLSYFKFLHYNFLCTISVYLFGVFLSFVGLLAFSENGLFNAELISPKSSLALALFSTGLILYAAYTIYSLILLKSMIWNIYGLVIVRLRLLED